MQVRHILLIFQKAMEVIAWLGDEGLNTSYALCMLRNNELLQMETKSDRSLNASGEVRGKHRESEVDIARSSSNHDSNQDAKYQDGQSNDHEAIEEGIRELLRRPWFRRVWVRS